MVAPTYLRSLQAVELAARTGSLKAAADILAITPAAAGQRVKTLEDFLEVELFVRGRAGLIPTEALVGALPYLKSAFRSLEAAADVLELQRAQDIHIAAEPDLADLWLKPRIADFQAAHPQIAISVNGEGDAGFRPAPADCEITFGPQDGERDVLFADYLLPFASPENSARIGKMPARDRLEGFPLLHLDFYRNDPLAPDWPEWIAAQGMNRTAPDRGIRFRRVVHVVEAMLADSGLAICGLALLCDRIDDGSLTLPFPVHTGRWTRHAFQARFRGETRPHVRRFREWLLAQATETRARLFEATA